MTNLNDRGPGSFREACETGGHVSLDLQCFRYY